MFLVCVFYKGKHYSILISGEDDYTSAIDKLRKAEPWLRRCHGRVVKLTNKIEDVSFIPYDEGRACKL